MCQLKQKGKAARVALVPNYSCVTESSCWHLKLDMNTGEKYVPVGRKQIMESLAWNTHYYQQ